MLHLTLISGCVYNYWGNGIFLLYIWNSPIFEKSPWSRNWNCKQLCEKLWTVFFRCSFLQIGYLDAVPFVTASVFAFIFAHFADWLIITNKLSITHTRKLANHICLTGTAFGFVSLCFVGCNSVLAETVIVFMVTANSTAMSCYMVSSNVHSPQYFGIFLKQCLLSIAK